MAGEPRTLRRTRVLFVEDDPLMRRALTAVLQFEGFAVTAVSSEVDLDGTAFDIGVFDLSLISGCGLNLAKHLLTARVVRDAVFYTGCVDEADLARAASVGTIVAKTDPEALLRRLKASPTIPPAALA